MPRTPLIIAAVLVGLAAPAAALAGARAGLSIQVDPRAGDDARCALVEGPDPRGVLGCRTLARAAALANQPVRAPLLNVYLAPGRHDVDAPVRFTRDVSVAGPGGVQAVVNMTGQGSLAFPAGVEGGRFGLTGTAPGTWITTAGSGGGLDQMTVVRARADAPTIRMTGANSLILNSVIAAQGNGVAVEMRGAGYLQNTTVSGGRVALGTNAADPDPQAPSVNASVLAGGVVSWGGTPGIYNSAVSVPQSWREPAIEVRDESPAAPAQGENYPRVVLSSVWQRACAPAIGLSRPTRAGEVGMVLLAGSLVRVPAPACGTIITGGLGAGAGRTMASITTNWFAPTPGPLLTATQGLDALVDGGSTSGDPRVEGGLAGANWPGGMMPAAGSPLINAATDPFSLSVAEVLQQSLSVPRYGEAGARPRGPGNLRNPAPDIGAYERPDVLGAVPPPPPPGPDGIAIQPDGSDGGLAPVVGGMPGAIAAPGAPTAGVDTGQRVSLPKLGKRAQVSVRVGRTAPVAGPVRVRLRAFQASRVVVVLRRDFRDQDRAKRSRVIGRLVVRFAKPGARWVSVPLNSGARRGIISVAATARQSGFDPGFDLAATRLTGRAPAAIAAPARLRAGLNRLTVTTTRAGRVVVVARTSRGRVVGRSAYVAPGAGRRVVALRLAPAGLVTGTITISARVAGAAAVSITRQAG